MISSSSSVQDELRNYLEEKDVKNLFVTMVEAILLEKPNAPVKFIAQFLKVIFIRTAERFIFTSFRLC